MLHFEFKRNDPFVIIDAKGLSTSIALKPSIVNDLLHILRKTSLYCTETRQNRLVSGQKLSTTRGNRLEGCNFCTEDATEEATKTSQRLNQSHKRKRLDNPRE